MVLEKGAVLEDDGTYTIQLSAYHWHDYDGATRGSVPLDIVLVLDQSGLHGWLKFDSSSNCCYQLCPDD